MKQFGLINLPPSQAARAPVVILPVPYERTTTYVTGTRRGPAAVLEASRSLELFDSELSREPAREVGIVTAPACRIRATSPVRALKEIERYLARYAPAPRFPVLIGGEHALSLAAIRHLKRTYPDLSVLQLDAHYDLRERYNGSPYNHACVGRRISELCPLTQVGMRSLSAQEYAFLRTGNTRSFSLWQMRADGRWLDRVVSSLSAHVYVTIDLDVFDPGMVPAVGTPEPGGMGWYEVLSLLRAVALHTRLVGCDVVELCPRRGQHAADFLAAKLIYKSIAYTFCLGKRGRRTHHTGR